VRSDGRSNVLRHSPQEQLWSIFGGDDGPAVVDGERDVDRGGESDWRRLGGGLSTPEEEDWVSSTDSMAPGPKFP
jgi:hypothetical protein